MASLNLTSFEAALKEYYGPQKLQDVTFKNRPFYAMVPKRKWDGGDVYPLPVSYGDPAGRSGTFSNAQTNANPGKYIVFHLTHGRNYITGTLDRLTIAASQSEKGAFQRATREIDKALNELANDMARTLYGSGTGSLSRLNNSSFATDVITLGTGSGSSRRVRPTDATKFEVGMIIRLAATDGGTPRTGSLEVTEVDYEAGTITVDEDISSGISAAAQDDFILVDGDTNTKPVGLAGWLPETAPGSTTFFGVDRTPNVVKLAGVRYDGSAQTHREAVIDGLERVMEWGDGEPDYIFMHPRQLANFVKAEQSLVRHVDVKPTTKANISFQGVEFYCNYGKVTAIPDRYCPDNLAYACQMEECGLYYTGPEPIHLVSPTSATGQEQILLWQSNADGYEYRAAHYGQFGIRAPGRCGVITLPSV